MPTQDASLNQLNEWLGKKWQTWDAISDHELNAIYAALLCTIYDIRIWECRAEDISS